MGKRKMLKKLSRHPVFQQFVGSSIAAYLRLVHLTSRYTIDPPDLYEDFFRDKPFIFTMWHGEHYISPFVKMMWKRKKQKRRLNCIHQGEGTDLQSSLILKKKKK